MRLCRFSEQEAAQSRTHVVNVYLWVKNESHHFWEKILRDISLSDSKENFTLTRREPQRNVWQLSTRKLWTICLPFELQSKKNFGWIFDAGLPQCEEDSQCCGGSFCEQKREGFWWLFRVVWFFIETKCIQSIHVGCKSKQSMTLFSRTWILWRLIFLYFSFGGGEGNRSLDSKNPIS